MKTNYALRAILRVRMEVLEDRRMLSGLPITLGVMGDSLSDEYGEQAYGAYADNWVEQLVTSGGIDVGPTGAWGEPRRTLYEYNWARYAATSSDLLSSGQHTGLASQIIPNGIDYAVLEIGANDFSPFSGIYYNIYSGAWTSAEINPYIDSVLTNISTALDTVLATGVKMVVGTTFDFGFTPYVQSVFDIPEQRQLVSDAIHQLNMGIIALAQEKHIVVADFGSALDAIFGPQTNLNNSVPIGNVDIQLHQTTATNPSTAGFVADLVHPNTPLQSIMANLFVQALDTGYNAGVPLFSEAQILANNGLAYGGSDTLNQEIGPYTDYVLNFADAPSTVTGRKLFYNQSGTGGATVRYDGNNLAINSLDDNAIATDKVAYLPSAPGAATFANMSSYSKGINGIMVDISGTHPSIGPSDFEFHVGNNNTPSGWSLANPPTSVSVRAGAGTSGSDRVEIIWNSGAPLKQWLEVAVLATVNTGLTALGGGYTGARASWGDVFYFGNPVGNTGVGDTAVNSTVNSIDEGGARNNPQVVGNNIPITNIYDVNRNAVVNAIDEGTIRNNNTNSTTVLKYLNLADPPLAPQGGGGGGDAGVASALTATATPSTTPSMPRWLGLRLDEIDLNSGRVADVFQRLHDVNNAGTRKLLLRADAIADALNLDHELLDSLLADLGLE